MCSSDHDYKAEHGHDRLADRGASKGVRPAERPYAPVGHMVQSKLDDTSKLPRE